MSRPKSLASLAPGLLALALLAGPVPAAAPALAAEATTATPAPAPAAPEAGMLLFEQHQLGGTKPGETLLYRYHLKVSDPELGQSFDDTIRLTVAASAPGEDKDARDLAVNFFSGERHRAAGPFEGVTGNPILILMLENHVRELSDKLKGNPRYFKNAIRVAMRDKAQVTPAKITLDGRTYDGWRVEITPFKGDSNAKRMRGLDGLTYDFLVSPDLPGEVASITITADAPGGRLFEEALTYDPKGS